MRSILEEDLSVLRKAHLEHVANISVNALSLFFAQNLADFSGIFLSEFSEIPKLKNECRENSWHSFLLLVFLFVEQLFDIHVGSVFDAPRTRFQVFLDEPSMTVKVVEPLFLIFVGIIDEA